MVRKELIKRSPVRILEKSIHGGVGKGNIAIIASPKGFGKTACLVHIATDSLLQGKLLIHVSFSSKTDHIMSWYEDIFREIARKRNLEAAMDVHDEIIRNRVIMNFNQNGLNTEQLVKSLKAMIEGANFAADQIIIDGFDFTKSSYDDLRVLKNFAVEAGVFIWFSATVSPESEEPRVKGVPASLEPFMDFVSVLITLSEGKDAIVLSLIKDHETYAEEELNLILDPKTLLMVEES
jgi:hypothetical protein